MIIRMLIRGDGGIRDIIEVECFYLRYNHIATKTEASPATTLAAIPLTPAELSPPRLQTKVHAFSSTVIVLLSVWVILSVPFAFKN
jgi:hypothetical protein